MKLLDIESVYKNKNRMIVKVIARINKANTDSSFSKKISYDTIYKTWRFFNTQAGIPDKLMRIHSFRLGVYCQSILNCSLKGITEDNMKVFSQLLAGWRTERDSGTYYKIEMKEQNTIDGYLEDPKPEILLGYDGIFKSLWKNGV